MEASCDTVGGSRERVFATLLVWIKFSPLKEVEEHKIPT